jgi:hypothetical protein
MPIVQSFQSMRNQFGQTVRQLEKKSADISVLKDLSELCYVTFDPEEILYITLERALLLTNSDIGSVLTLEKSERKAFIVKAAIGLSAHVKPGERIDFDQHRKMRSSKIAPAGGEHRTGQALRPGQSCPLRYEVICVHAVQDQQRHHRRAQHLQPGSPADLFPRRDRGAYPDAEQRRVHI